jgi:hypothetical protein
VTPQASTNDQQASEYYSSRGSDVYITLLDASKAFDRVEFTSLFRLLLNKGICPIVARFLLRLYTQQKIRVRWGDAVTQGFGATNGVKQGGVLSPCLFTIYINPLLMRLKETGIGCHIGDVFCGSLGYADDVVLIAPTRQSLMHQLRICAEYAEEFSLSFNASKSKLIHIPHNRTRPMAVLVPVPFMGGTIEEVPHDRHLGCLVGNMPVVKELALTAAINDFNKKVGMVRSHFKWLLPNAKYFLFKSFCMPLYGCVLWDFSHRSIERFYIAWRKAVRALLGLHPRTHCALLHHVCGDQDPESQLLARCVSFCKSLARSPNAIVRKCFAIALQGSRSHVGRNLSLIAEKARCARDAVLTGDPVSLFPREDAMAAEGSLVHDLLLMRHDLTVLKLFASPVIPLDDVNFIINYVSLN